MSFEQTPIATTDVVSQTFNDFCLNVSSILFILEEHRVRCDGCRTYPIYGKRYTCTSKHTILDFICRKKCDYDICEACNIKGTYNEHKMEQVMTTGKKDALFSIKLK